MQDLIPQNATKMGKFNAETKHLYNRNKLAFIKS